MSKKKNVPSSYFSDPTPIYLANKNANNENTSIEDSNPADRGANNNAIVMADTTTAMISNENDIF